jgi:hypothetical protein
MKSSLFFLFTAAAWAQSATPPPDTPTATYDLGKQLANATVPADTVIATYDDGQKLTIGELTSFLAAMPPNMAQAARRDRKAFVQQFAMMHRLSEMAVKAKLDEQSPTKEALAFNRMYLLMNAQLHDVLTTMKVPPADVESFYNTNKERFKQVKVKAIYIPFAADPSKPGATEPKRLTEAEALAKIAGLKTAIAGGASFVKLVKENSEDATSAAKDGDFGTLRSTDNLPDAIRTAVFALKAGEVSDPVKQPNGFYLFRAEEITTQPFTEVQNDIVKELKTIQFQAWVEETKRSLNVKMQENASATSGAAPAASK